ncbi:methyltransferase domain-containing protein [Nocardioides insulae]|uniref:methyltransferase domain-containing protein n=1 Tax=Nocardioides insulae TaxID=394734 RepID=UPI00146C2A5C|nr:methyltransferase domain-containing protein [Nocardioides insulae]
MRAGQGARRLGSSARHTLATWAATPGAAPGYEFEISRPNKQCLVCAGEHLRRRQLAYSGDPTLTCRTRRCLDCGFVTIVRSESGKYREITSFEDLPRGRRAGTVDRPGREFQMGRMGLEILAAEAPDVLLYGVGSSMDNLHLEKLGRTGMVGVGDIMQVRSDEHFFDISRPAEQRFDLVIASEVIEHFRTPRPDFRHMLDYVEDDGLLICGTDINDGYSELRKHRYIFYPDHTSYYTPEALAVIARAEGWLVDFRAVGRGRKRYVFLSRSRDVMDRVALYFGHHALAPMESSG